MLNPEKYENPPDDRNVAVVGLSSDESRPSFSVSRYLQKRGYKIIPVNPKETEILGEKAYTSLSNIPDKVDIVDIFRRSEFVPPIVDDAVKIGAKVIWLQEGVINHPAAIKASQQGVLVVMDKCILKEHRKLGE
jgi:predicted CoA-binding protein